MRYSATILLHFFFSASIVSQNTSLKITPLTGDFYVFTTWRNFRGNPVSSHGLYVVTKEGVAMIDTPWDTTQFQPLLDSIELKHKQKVVMCIATHSHEDRTAGLEYYSSKGIKTFTSLMTDEICIGKKEKRAQFHFMNDTTFKIGPYTFQTYYAGGAHTNDNIFIWLGAGKILYGGCAVKSTEATDLGNIADANLQEWPSTLNKVKKKFPSPKFIITGHQSWTGTGSIDHTLDLLRITTK
ncbi:MAG: BlaB/IND/MUS family subclass B1 metallo-beta-lactamase [Bacteroidia bacterium]